MYHNTNTTNRISRRIVSIRSLLFLICASFVIYLIEFDSTKENQYGEDDLVNEALQNVASDFRYYHVYRNKSKLPKNIKYILLWTPYDYAPFYTMGEGQRHFIRNNCTVINCYVTTDRNFFGGDVTIFDAIAFNGRNLGSLKQLINYWDLPKERSPQQKYIYVMTESADLYPECDEMFDNFFNWTYSYRLDSTVINPYIIIKNKNGEVVGPRKEMEWVDMSEDEELLPYEHNKTKAAAWFVSNCVSRSKRNKLVKDLQHALSSYGMAVDVYGSCGTLQCPRDRKEECLEMLEKNYFFYLALENSFDEDYITEKVLTAFNNNVVPIVYGGANYSRFLPPHSYLDALQYTPEELAATMVKMMKSKKLYQRYFWWKRYYSYLDYTAAASYNLCSLCSTINNSSLFSETSVYDQFRRFWNPNYEKRCSG
ncbi:alpha-(1,3)-fucosyltransferase C-like [Plodia interpunctella]|uniref:alpha-(1,3)-fucosyltransferase C-like n=1 Tax=Plodia interpunctella TaxID=58824 RepID=UPI002368670C|nr:alpha-(1,3)-fucosyltransferase C-like isoform X1 [Plodia interpunctella]XP_053616388.1 alpha-(1,3)-fucosyltransferase C-like isoform X1 [Plodia interpunctella]XP_053616389.1 alpha-(1,3)-fucosyltransferase C-like isoform X1 [Plodia interpunctella]XP_053616390.1 alpha-(1,3)-fucosyltransferase C-like isoform X1 [Plodia interpunctella]XP_053616391.1 alpha-(1,3)-fucosyltransferase C-like isoform X1 [Plodia interpunctella]XP_053616392.1 alpha-(1,3)-fucosyltransferase C-like isoform X1 [Plodia int